MHYALIDTALGAMGVGWTGRGISRFLLPDSEAALRERIAVNAEPAAPDPALAARIVSYADGNRVKFNDVPVDLTEVPDFHRQVYADIRTLGWGITTRYGDIARRLGDVQLSRAVGQALGRNPIPLIIPCHRVLAANDAIGGFSAPGGRATKRKMLALERASLPSGQFAFGF